MELTTSWQKLAEKKLGSSYGDLYIRIYARYTTQNENALTTTTQYQARAYFSGNWILDQNSSGSISGTGATSASYSKSDRYNNGETTLKTIEGTVSHDPDTGEASITTSASLNFPNWGWSQTATGTATLPTIDVSTLRLRVNGSWVKAKPYLRINGSWVQCKAYLRDSGSWKKGV